MLQLPIIAVQRTEFMQRRKTFNNVMFWFSMIYGLSTVSEPLLLLSSFPQGPSRAEMAFCKKQISALYVLI
jgi:hypothetical protein